MDNQGGVSASNMQVFRTIAELVAGSEFQDASFQYLDQHKDVFTDDDENKLEYTIIFENYVQILDTVIDAKLYQQFNEQTITDFYLDFKDGYKKYEAEDAETVETLFGFTDFNKFKKQMLEFKAGIGITGLNKEEQSSTADYANKGEDYYFKLIGESLSDKKTGWKKRLDHKEKNLDIIVHQRPSDGDDHLARIDVTFRGISLDTMKEFMHDIDSHMSEGSKMLKETKILERDENDMPAALYNCVKLPLMNEREMLLKSIFKDYEGGKYLVLFHSIERDDYPIKPDKIRVNMFRGMLWWQEGNELKSTHMQQVNFKGYFPMRLMNMAVGNAVKKQIREVMYPKLSKMEQQKRAK